MQWAAIALLVAGMIMFQVWPLATPAGCEQPEPILCAELPVDAAALRAAVDPPGDLRENVLADLPFIAGYALVMAAGRGPAVIALVAAGALLDLSENLGIWRAIEAPAAITEGHARWVRCSAQAKFAALSLALVLIALRSRARPWLRWSGAALAIAGVVAAVHPRTVALSLGVLAVGVTILALAPLVSWASARLSRTRSAPR